MRFLYVSLLFAAVIVAVSCAGPEMASNQPANKPSAQNSAPSPATVDEMATGRKLFNDNCAACHREDGTGGKVEIDGRKLNPDNLTSDKIKKFSDEKILGFIVNGIPDEGMPAMKGKLSEAEMREIVRYLRTEIQKVAPKAAASPAA